MKRLLFVVFSTLALASAAHAVSVAIVADQVSYLPGQTVTLSVVVDATGAESVGFFGFFTYDASILLGGNVTQTPMTSFGFEWLTGVTPCPSPDVGGACLAFNQTFQPAPLPVDQPAGFVLSTITFTAGALGSTDIEWVVDGDFRSPSSASPTRPARR